MSQHKISETEKMIVKLLQKAKTNPEALDDVFSLNRQFRDEDAQTVDGKTVPDQYHMDQSAKYNGFIRRMCAEWIKYYGVEECVDIYKRSLLFDAPTSFDAYCRYIEWNRPQKKRFYEPRRKQLKPVADAMQELADGKLELLSISLPPGVGKALANDTPILTRNGWKNHGDLVVGDEVIGMDGEFKKVIAVHPKCQLDCLVEFTNGEKIVCHENHEWLIHDRPIRDNAHKVHLTETKRLEKRKLESGGEAGHRGHRYDVQLPKKEYVKGEHKNLPLDPYTLGVWLGDGTATAPRIACAIQDTEIIEKITNNGISLTTATQHNVTGVLYFDLNIRENLRSLGMCHSRKTLPKRIPDDYLTASVQQRLELLAGLIDTDGTRSGQYKIQFSTTSEELRDSFVSLISTFGWRACVVKQPPHKSCFGIEGRKDCYVISFTPDCVIPCVLGRKRVDDPHKQRAIAFKSITRIEPKEGNCITVEGDGMYLAGKTMLPTHNTTLSIFYMTWLGGQHPELSILGGSHSNSFLRGVYDEMIRILDKDGEYLYNDVFSDSPMVNTNSKDLRIDLAKQKRFETFEFNSLQSGSTGKVRCSRLLYCDDLIDGIETAMSRERLDKLWQQYYTDLRQRKIGDCVELHVATRWSIADPIGRLQQMYDGNPAAKFLAFPALDEFDRSNFDYPYKLGFTTEFYRQQREIMDDASWKALYMNQPIEREGRLYDPEELRYYFSLPEKEPDAILAICDTKEQGDDYLAMPILYQYGQDYYLDKWVCDNGKVEILEEKVALALVDRNVRLCRIESNRGGTLFASNVQKRVRELGGVTTITTKWTQSNKEARIQTNSGYVKAHVLFRDATVRDKEYKTAMDQLIGYTMSGKNKNDDVPDVLSMFVNMIVSSDMNTATVMKRPF